MKSIILGRVASLTVGILPFVVGAHKGNQKKFLMGSAIGCLIWATIFTGIGFIFGKSYYIAGEYFTVTLIVFAIVIILLYIIYNLFMPKLLSTFKNL